MGRLRRWCGSGGIISGSTSRGREGMGGAFGGIGLMVEVEMKIVDPG